MQKKIFMIAGPNGAGKTTTAKELISMPGIIHEYINADEIARGLAPKNPESVAISASKLMIKRFRELLDSNKSFAFETTGSGTNYLKHLKEAQSKGYEFTLLFLWLPSAEQAIDRVTMRVKLGGHNIPENVIKRRYDAGLKNLMKHYLPLANIALVLDNSSTNLKRVIALKAGKGLVIRENEIWEKIQEFADA